MIMRESERALEIQTIWRNTVVDTINVTDKPVVTMGDQRVTVGWGPFQRLVRCDIEVPSRGLASPTFPFATLVSSSGCSYAIAIDDSFTAHMETRNVRTEIPRGTSAHRLEARETMYLGHGALTFQVRYVRRRPLIQPAFWEDLNYTWVNVLILASFFHLMAIVSFLASPIANGALSDGLLKATSDFVQARLTARRDALSRLESNGASSAKANDVEGKSGRKQYRGKKQGRLAIKGDHDGKELARSMLSTFFGGRDATSHSALFGRGGLAGELKDAIGGVTGPAIGDATGMGGLGTRGAGPGGGGLSMRSIGVGILDTAARGGGHRGYGEGVADLEKTPDRSLVLTPGPPTITGSLDKELIRRVIKDHLAQIRYCYEKELARSPGLFGKVGTEFTISSDGTVQAASIRESTISNSAVEGCILSKIRTWIFPKPNGGGVVIVKYPFIFKTTG